MRPCQVIFLKFVELDIIVCKEIGDSPKTFFVRRSIISYAYVLLRANLFSTLFSRPFCAFFFVREHIFYIALLPSLAREHLLFAPFAHLICAHFFRCQSIGLLFGSTCLRHASTRRMPSGAMDLATYVLEPRNW